MKSGMIAPIAANGKTSAGEVEHPSGQSMWLIHTRLDGGKSLENHYPAGNPPFPLKNMLRWLGKTGLLEKHSF
jgi:hypothetical protein